jgi:hypothetical protein
MLGEAERAAIAALEGVTLAQRTPQRVEMRRADLTRERRILKLSDLAIFRNEIEVCGRKFTQIPLEIWNRYPVELQLNDLAIFGDEIEV